jgi:hypothetical protein
MRKSFSSTPKNLCRRGRTQHMKTKPSADTNITGGFWAGIIDLKALLPKQGL